MIDKILSQLDEDLRVEEKATNGLWRFILESPSVGFLHCNNQIIGEGLYIYNGEFIAHSRNVFKSRIDALKIALGALNHIVKSYERGSCCDEAFLNEKMDIHLVEVSEFAIKEIAQCLGVES